MNLLITGGSGFVGKNLLNMIYDKNEYKKIKCFVLASEKLDNCIYIDHRNYKFTKDDIVNSGLGHVDTVIHLGAFTPKIATESDDLNGSLSNIVNTMHLISNLPNIPSKFIFISSTSVYQSTNDIIDENTKEDPESMYGYSKLYCEKMLEKYCKTNNIKYQILRLGPIYGRGEENYKRLIPTTLRQLAENKVPYVVNGGENIRSFIHVKDVCNIILKTLELEDNVGPINVVSNQEHRIIDLIELSITISNCKVQPEKMYRETNDIDQRFNNEKMRKWLDCEHILIKDGLYEEYEYIKQELLSRE